MPWGLTLTTSQKLWGSTTWNSTLGTRPCLSTVHITCMYLYTPYYVIISHVIVVTASKKQVWLSFTFSNLDIWEKTCFCDPAKWTFGYDGRAYPAVIHIYQTFLSELLISKMLNLGMLNMLVIGVLWIHTNNCLLDFPVRLVGANYVGLKTRVAPSRVKGG